MRLHIAVPFLYDADFQGVANVTKPHVQNWCANHAYSFQQVAHPTVERNIQWHRVRVIKALLESGYDAVFHIDADCLITNPAIKLEDLIIPAADLMMAREPGGAFNDGTSIWMNTPAMREALPKIWEAESPDCTSANGVIQKWHDEETLPFVLGEIPKRKINSYPPEWAQGDFILHCPGHSNEARIRIFNRVLNPTDPLTGEWWKEEA